MALDDMAEHYPKGKLVHDLDSMELLPLEADFVDSGNFVSLACLPPADHHTFAVCFVHSEDFFLCPEWSTEGFLVVGIMFTQPGLRDSGV